MVAPVFTDEELEGLRRFPEIGREELFRFFTLASADVTFIDPGRGRGPTDRLGLAVAVCTDPVGRIAGVDRRRIGGGDASAASARARRRAWSGQI